MSQKYHCDKCDKVLDAGSIAPLKSTSQVECVVVEILAYEHLCHPCRKAVIESAVQSIVIEQWWDPK